MNANIRTIGGALGAAMVTSILASYGSIDGFPTDAGFTTAFGILTAAGLLGLVSCLLIPSRSRKEFA